MAEDFLSKDDAAEKLLVLPSLLFPDLFGSKKKSGRNLEFRGRKRGENSFDIKRMNRWIKHWDTFVKTNSLFYEENILPALEIYEDRCKFFWK
mmetsp:Transcript_4408/g.5005  ORF Transcript_4408/g.5005 Transcript_4408/m.5005 type:complete len:93 (+) Transcript_4408:1015-1293(+)